MGILGTVLVVLGIAVAGLIGWGVLMVFARGMSDVPLDAHKSTEDTEN